MLRQLVLGVEEEVARQTDVRTILLVDAAHVLLQVRQLQERGWTQLTLERFLARVQTDVKFQCRRVRKGLLTNLAFVRTFTRVCPHVNLQLRPLSEAMIARFATERLLVGVGTQVLQKVSLEGSLADGALERFHASVVAAEMFAEAVAACEGFGANWARVVALSGVPSHMHLDSPRSVRLC